MEHRKRILITDDDPAIQDVFQMILEQAGYETDVHASGEQLLTGSYQRPDLFILDKQLCGIDGLDICRHLKADEFSKGIPIIIISASPMLDELATEAGADDFQEKPFKMHELLNKVRVLLDQRSFKPSL